MSESNLRLLPPHAMRLAQMHTELGAHACAHMGGGYDLINELFYKLYDDVLSMVVPDPSQLDTSASKLYSQLKNFGSEDTSTDTGAPADIAAVESKKFEFGQVTIFECFGIKVREVNFNTELVEPINKVTYPWWKVRNSENLVRAYISDADGLFKDWPDAKMVWVSDTIDRMVFSSDYPAPGWWLEQMFSNKTANHAPGLPT